LTDVEFTGESSGDDENTLTLNNDADDVATSAYDTTVVMNTLAMIELQEVQKTLVDGLNLVV
jgi:hypothetical protein